MSRIRRLAPVTCPRCGAQNVLFIDLQRQLKCRLCGHVVGKSEADAAPDAEEKAAPVPELTPTELRRRYPISYALISPDEVDPWAKSAYHSGLAYLEQEQYDRAIAAFRRALESQPDFLDAHLWLGRLLQDEQAKRHHFTTILARMPNYAEAIRELMVLQGEITPQEAERARQGGGRTAAAEAPVMAAIQTQECPVCGGEMHAAHDGRGICQSCGFQRSAPRSISHELRSFTVEMLRRRGQKVRWEVGERLMRCKSCGAETLLQPQALTVRCPFCGSRGVIEADALRSFVQPDGVVLFDLSLQEAQDALDAALNSRAERIKGLFVNNRVESVRITPVYLPFWLFDLTLQVNVTVEDRRLSINVERALERAYQTRQTSDSLFDVPVCGAESPPRSLTDRLEPFLLGHMQAYHPQLLAGKAAELYQLDFEPASLLARQRVSEQMRRQYGHGSRGGVVTRVVSLVQTMQFRLALLPVYVVVVIERDGDHRSVVIHGQTGQVVLGVAARPRR